MSLALGLLLARPGLPEPPPPRPADEGSLAARYRQPADLLYRSPVGLALSPDGRWLYTTCERQGTVIEIDRATRRLARTFAFARESMPFALLPSRDGQRLWVSLRGTDQVGEVDLATGQPVRLLTTGDDPHGLATDPAARTLYVANLGEDNLSLLDLASGEERRRIGTGRLPFDLAVSPDGRWLFASAQSSLPVPFQEPTVLELTTVDLRTDRAADRRDLVSTIIGQGVAVSPDGAFVVVALELPKNLIPETQIFQGWMVTHGLAVAEAGVGGRLAYVLLDEPNLYYADPFGVAFSPDGQRLYVTSSGVDVLSVLDWPRVLQTLRVTDGKIGLDDGAIARLARNLTASNDYVVARLPTGRNPKQVVVSPDGAEVYVACRLDDAIDVFATDEPRRIARIDLGGPREDTELRRGEVVFNYATISFQQQLSCNTCHPENHLDGLTYNIAADGGMGHNLVDNRTLRGAAGTEPLKWSGKNPSFQRQEGPRAAQLFFRSHGFEPPDVEAITHFIESNALTPNRHRREKLDPAQRRGKKLFERSITNDGRYIPVANRCITCHEPPLYTDRLKHDVGSKYYHDDHREYDVPQLNNLYEQGPFLHDGRTYSLEEIWTVFSPDDTHGVTNDMTKEQLNFLIEYLKTL
ncbi:MAG: hypothetical protein RBU45_13150 [Myxococcota bacterium]|nr:hypothetical protein [Myxococcota bacterium]